MEAKKNAWFITLIGPDTYATFKDLWSPVNPSTVSFDQMCREIKISF